MVGFLACFDHGHQPLLWQSMHGNIVQEKNIRRLLPTSLRTAELCILDVCTPVISARSPWSQMHTPPLSRGGMQAACIYTACIYTHLHCRVGACKPRVFFIPRRRGGCFLHESEGDYYSSFRTQQLSWVKMLGRTVPLPRELLLFLFVHHDW